MLMAGWRERVWVCVREGGTAAAGVRATLWQGERCRHYE